MWSSIRLTLGTQSTHIKCSWSELEQSCLLIEWKYDPCHEFLKRKTSTSSKKPTNQVTTDRRRSDVSIKRGSSNFFCKIFCFICHDVLSSIWMVLTAYKKSLDIWCTLAGVTRLFIICRRYKSNSVCCNHISFLFYSIIPALFNLECWSSDSGERTLHCIHCPPHHEINNILTCLLTGQEQLHQHSTSVSLIKSLSLLNFIHFIPYARSASISSLI